MKSIIIVSILFLGRSADCADDPIKSVIDEYKISALGFGKDIPKSDSPPDLGNKDDIVARVIASPGYLSDGFSHSVIYVKFTATVWVHRTGGLAGIDEWYGPIQIK